MPSVTVTVLAGSECVAHPQTDPKGHRLLPERKDILTQEAWPGGEDGAGVFAV